ncbi:hypothetical protein BLM14_22615 (plasmid) [Phyllobacterium zundukense]|nr:hypothetical protein BLM14_22615 [Phyllobacterium zundukense]
MAYAAMEAAPQVRFIFISSSETYGISFNECKGEPISENVILKPINAYGASKAAAEAVVAQLANEGLNTIRFRPFNHTGPGQTDEYVVAAFAKQLAEISVGLRPPVIKLAIYQHNEISWMSVTWFEPMQMSHFSIFPVRGERCLMLHQVRRNR